MRTVEAPVCKTFASMTKLWMPFKGSLLNFSGNHAQVASLGDAEMSPGLRVVLGPLKKWDRARSKATGDVFSPFPLWWALDTLRLSNGARVRKGKGLITVQPVIECVSTSCGYLSYCDDCDIYVIRPLLFFFFIMTFFRVSVPWLEFRQKYALVDWLDFCFRPLLFSPFFLVYYLVNLRAAVASSFRV